VKKGTVAVRAISYSCLLLLCAHTAAYGGLFSYDSYEDCMLGRMKGQSQMMFATADKACKKQFRVETYISTGSVKWEFGGGQIVITSASDGSDSYEVATGEFSFSPKPCEGLTNADFGKPVQLQFTAGKARMPFDAEEMHCGRALSFHGKYK
jgi:hypothetical protein